MAKLFTEGFKESVVEKILNRGSRTVLSICESQGVGLSTGARWVQNHGTSMGMKKQKSSLDWSAAEKLKALTDTANLSESELGMYVRKEGLYTHNLSEWRTEVLSSLNIKKTSLKKDERDQKIKSLEREILRKDKALAEASALLILQKKVNLIWGNKDEDEK